MMKCYELLDKPEKWTRRAFARSNTGEKLLASDSTAVCWCVLGAILVCYDYEKVSDKQTDIEDEVGRCISKWNDDPSVTYEDVIAVFKKLDI
jgi:hypothetical protein